MKMMIQSSLKSLIVGLAYWLAMAIGGMVVNLVGLTLPETDNVQATLVWTFVGGVIAGLFLGPIAASFPVSRRHHVIFWGSVVFFNLVSVAIAGYFFAPELIADSLTVAFIQLLLAALATGWVVTFLCAPKGAAGIPTRVYRPFFSMFWRFTASALGYVVF